MIYFTPGPTQLHPEVPAAMREAESRGLLSLSHRSPEFTGTVASTVEALRELLSVPRDHEIFFLGSATECMDRILWGAVKQHSLHLVNGAFARRFHQLGLELGLGAEAAEVPDGEGFSTVELPSHSELVALTQNETSTGVAIPPDWIAALARRHPSVLVAVDVVSGWPHAEVELELVDAAFFSVQKGFGLPAGLGVMVASPRLLERARTLRREVPTRGGGYHNLLSLAQAASRSQTVATPNMLAIHLLGVVARAYLRDGVPELRDATVRKARLFYEAVEALPGWRPFVARVDHRSPTVVVAQREDGVEVQTLQRHLRDGGMEVGGGYGAWKEKHLRFANFPVHSMEDVERLVHMLTEVSRRTP
ncbi:MAG: aminotransferase class V-fold PLP-dependent enzyme [Gemmatimonadota bacterium]